MPPANVREVDLHGHTPEGALRALGQALHSARVQGQGEIRVITGRGVGNRRGEPVLRGYVENWLRGPDGKRYGVTKIERSRDGGSLKVGLR